jgi:hypothetical protein
LPKKCEVCLRRRPAAIGIALAIMMGACGGQTRSTANPRYCDETPKRETPMFIDGDGAVPAQVTIASGDQIELINLRSLSRRDLVWSDRTSFCVVSVVDASDLTPPSWTEQLHANHPGAVTVRFVGSASGQIHFVRIDVTSATPTTT